jgi:fructan beta-fructosidase
MDEGSNIPAPRAAMNPIPFRAIALAVLLAATASGQDRPDLTVADFEGDGYRPWMAQGDAFGTAPARGALPGQMAVEGFEGRGLVNSFLGGDDSTGSLTSPPFLIERRHLNFLIGGGKYPGETCLDLLVDGRVVRTATGPNDRPGGSERLDWASWDVAEFAGQSALLRVVDRRKGGWGHVNVDQILQSDRPRGIVTTVREMVAERPFLIVPVEEKAPIRRVKVTIDGGVVREFDVKLSEGTTDFSSFLDLEPFRGKRLVIEARLPADSKALWRITQADLPLETHALYRESGRPQFHFTSRRGWLNDPNGLVFFEGEYHLFYQHNPYGWDWGNMHWGHAVAPDLVHWKELPIALYPREYGDWAFSGSAVVDSANSSGFGNGTAPPLVGAYTSTGRGECIVWSLDKGRTWAEYPGNPVVRHQGRDPRLLWHAPTKRWVMAVYDEEGGRRDVAFYSSADLKAWAFESRIGGFYECPDLFELPVEGTPGKTLWVLSAADGAYLLGEFDGKTFRPGPVEKQKTWHGNFYAAQTFSNEPKGRRVQVGWANEIAFPGQPFNQQMTIPCELTLRPTADGVRLFANPVAEVDRLRVGEGSRFGFPSGARIGAGGEGGWSLDVPSDLLDIRAEFEVGQGGEFSLGVPGASVSYDVARRSLACNGTSAPLDPVDGTIRLRLLVDRGSIEVFANDGRLAISRGLTKHGGKGELSGKFSGGGTRVRSFEFAEMGPAWR